MTDFQADFQTDIETGSGRRIGEVGFGQNLADRQANVGGGKMEKKEVMVTKHTLVYTLSLSSHHVQTFHTGWEAKVFLGLYFKPGKRMSMSWQYAAPVPISSIFPICDCRLPFTQASMSCLIIAHCH